MDKIQIQKEIENGQTCLGIEFGSTRVKAVLINSENMPIAQGAFDWENSLDNGIWTYPLEKIQEGLTTSFHNMKKDVQEKYNISLKKLKAMGVSAMMHGYLVFDKDDKLLVPFRTWRNTITKEASEKLSELFNYPIPERWSISHLYQSILKNEPHVSNITFMTTLAGYIHWILTGNKVIGIGDASGMFPIDTTAKKYNKKMLDQFSALDIVNQYEWDIESILPSILIAGEKAGTLTADGAALLDIDHELEAGIPFCPPEGDAGTGMIATNSVAPRTGNISAGTSVFAMIVLEKQLSKTYNGLIDLVTTPDGFPAAMAHANNCTGEYDKWMNMFKEVVTITGNSISKGQFYDLILEQALKGDSDCGGLIPYNYISGESITGFNEGRPLFVRTSKCNFTLQNFMRAQLFTALGALRAGMDILFDKEQVKIDKLTGHGGFFKTAEVGLKITAAAMHTAVSALETAGEGGPWGMAVLASYMINGADSKLQDFLDKKVFAEAKSQTVEPDVRDIEGFNAFFANYKKGLAIEKAAVENLN